MNRLSRAPRLADAGAIVRACHIGATLFVLALSSLGASLEDTNSPAKTGDLTDLPLEALMNLEVPKVYAASKLEQKTTEAPASITIVTSDDIKKFGYRTLADLLESVPGFNISYDRDYDYLGAMGISLGDANNRILLLVDGHRVNNNLTDSAAIGTDFILDIDLVDRVEVIHGPSAVLYGNNAFLGVINVITRKAGQINAPNGVETSFDYGAFNSYHGRVTIAESTNGLNLLLSGSIYQSAGAERLFFKQFDTPAQNNGVAQNMDGDLSRSFFASLGYGDFTWETAYNYRAKVNPTAQYDLTTFDDPRLETIDGRGYTALKYTHDFPDVVSVTAQVYGDLYTHYIGYPQSAVVGTNVLYNAFITEHDSGEWWGTELELNKTLWDRDVVTLGGEYRNDFLQEEDISGQTPIFRTRESYGIYLQNDLAVCTNLHLNTGVRYDKYSDFNPALDPRLALIYNPIPSSTIKAIYGTAFRVPDFDELSDPRFQNISPERITSYELDYDQQINPHLTSSIRGYYNQMNNLIVFDDGVYTNFNAQTKGTELALEGTWADGIRTRASYSFQYTKNDTVNWQVPDSPENMVKLNLSVPLLRDKIFAGAEFQYTSDRLSLHNATDAMGEPITVQGEEAGGFAVINLTLFSRNLVKNVEFSGSVYNLLNRRYVDPASDFHVEDVIEQNGRTFRVKVTYRF